MHSMGNSLLQAISSMLMAIENDKFFAHQLHIDFSRKKASHQHKSLFMSDSTRGILKRKDFRAVDM